jgi:hypothetical protein
MNEDVQMTEEARTPEPESAAMDALMVRLGYVMLHWSLLESAVLQEIKRLRSADGDTGESSIRARGAFSERLAEWQALVNLKGRRNTKIANEVGDIASKAERLRRTRNLLAQHFVGAEERLDGGCLVFVSESGVSSLRSSQAAYTSAQLGQLIDEMRDARSRILLLKNLVAD